MPTTTKEDKADVNDWLSTCGSSDGSSTNTVEGVGLKVGLNPGDDSYIKYYNQIQVLWDFCTLTIEKAVKGGKPMKLFEKYF